MQTNPLELLARVGWELLLPDPLEYAGDPDDEEASKNWDRQSVLHRLLTPPESTGDALFYAGQKITWPKRCPNLVTWAGQQNLEGLIKKRQECVDAEEARDPFTYVANLTGESGLDPDFCQTPMERGWSADAEGIALPQRPLLELLGIIGAEVTPIVSFGPRQCGIIIGGIVHRFPVRCRVGYYYMWCHSRKQ